MSKDIPGCPTAIENTTVHVSVYAQAIPTLRGEILIEGPVTANRLSTMEMCPQMNNFRSHHTQLQTLIKITELPRGEVYLARRDQTIIGYVTFHKPDDDFYWGRHDRLIEMGGIEIARQWRCYHVATALLEYIFSGNYWDDFIVVSFEFCRHWDLQGNKLSIWEYRSMMDKLLGQVNFNPRYTNMFDILTHPANTLMVRCGKNVNQDDWDLFNLLTRSF